MKSAGKKWVISIKKADGLSGMGAYMLCYTVGGLVFVLNDKGNLQGYIPDLFKKNEPPYVPQERYWIASRPTEKHKRLERTLTIQSKIQALKTALKELEDSLSEE